LAASYGSVNNPLRRWNLPKVKNHWSRQ